MHPRLRTSRWPSAGAKSNVNVPALLSQGLQNQNPQPSRVFALEAAPPVRLSPGRPLSSLPSPLPVFSTRPLGFPLQPPLLLSLLYVLSVTSPLSPWQAFPSPSLQTAGAILLSFFGQGVKHPRRAGGGGGSGNLGREMCGWEAQEAPLGRGRKVRDWERE